MDAKLAQCARATDLQSRIHFEAYHTKCAENKIRLFTLPSLNPSRQKRRREKTGGDTLTDPYNFGSTVTLNREHTVQFNVRILTPQ